ncbi:hypothetical protein HHI36_019616 [Cryptolaemus montrouzieri]|uniref:Uncharacterized protein n=1 Tax=Cryptolaemus montrouzieri TaxID=559131 RepID=A0ABD2N848_9CUCU
MMSLNITVPEIAITPEAEEDDDNNFLNLAEALTDIEELFDESISTKNQCYRKKLRIKVSDNDGYNTALEDVEASDDEDTTIIKQHKHPIILDDLDMEEYTAEENQGVEKKSDVQYLNTQLSVTRSRRMSESFNNTFALTDVEEYDTDNDDQEDDIPDNEFHLDKGESVQTVKISDDLQDKNQLVGNEAYSPECPTPNTSTHFPISLFETADIVPPRKKPPTFSQIMKAKAKSNENKMRRRRRNKTCLRKFNDMKNSDESESTDTESKVPKNRKFILSMNSLQHESDIEEENKLSFPVCKKTFTRNTNLLQMPEFNINNLTDVEDVDCDIDIYRRRVSVDSTIFQKQLDEMASCYSFTKDKNEAKDIRNEQIQDDKLKRNESIKKEFDLSHNLIQNSLAIPTTDEAGGTDMENIDSNSENEETDPGVAGNSSDTEEEDMGDDEPIDIIDLPETTLPLATRLLIISEESKSLIPTMHILPLDDNLLTDSEAEKQSTEDECFDSFGDINDKDELRMLHSPSLPVFEGGSINVSEDCIYSKNAKSNIEEEATDIEDLDVDVSKNKEIKRPKSKYLMPTNISSAQLTDVEDLDMNDDKSGISPQVNTEIDEHTDLEALESSDEGDNESKLRKSKNNKKLSVPLLILPGHTDTEEVVGTTDDEITYSRAETATPFELRRELDQASSIQVNIENSSKIDYTAPEEVMYLKGGGFQETPTDTEELFEDAELPFQDVMEAWEYFNYLDGNSGPEWEASEENHEDVSNTQPETARKEIKGKFRTLLA